VSARARKLVTWHEGVALALACDQDSANAVAFAHLCLFV
jgi:hypothetical protein